jgi:hypothetical protein
VKKLLSSLVMAGLLVAGGFSVVGCSSTPTTEKKDPPKGDKAALEKAVKDAKEALAKAEKDLEAKKDDEKLKKAVDDAKAALKKAEDALAAFKP